MRCPKCSFISFDDLTNCAKCSNNLSALAQQLHGTCTEARVPFFLSSVVQSPESDDQTLSQSQALPAIDDADIKFDETVAGDFSVADETDLTVTDFDDSIEISEDDISFELGDIMPIDLDQLDETGEFDNEDVTQSLAMGSQEEGLSLEDIDLDLGNDFADQSSEFDATEILNTNIGGEEINFDMTGDFDEGVDLDLSGEFDGLDFDDTKISPLVGVGAEEFSLTDNDSFSLDEELQPSLTGDFPRPDQDQTEEFELDGSFFGEVEETKIEELDTDFTLNDDLDEESPIIGSSVAQGLDPDEFSAADTLEDDIFALDEEESDSGSAEADVLGNELLATMDEEMDFDFAELDSDQAPDLNSAELDSGKEDTESSLADSLRFDQSDGVFDDDEFAGGGHAAPSLGLEEIDVSDLVPSLDQGEKGDDSAGFDLTSLMEDDDREQDLDLELLDDDIPQIELVDEDDE
jgi:hypothetical protein